MDCELGSETMVVPEVPASYPSNTAKDIHLTQIHSHAKGGIKPDGTVSLQAP